MVDVDPSKKPAPPLVALCGWLVPGLGYWLIGEKTRAIYSLVAIVGLFIGSLFVAGVRTIDVPGYNYRGQKILTADDKWVLTSNPVQSLLATPHFIPEVFAGPMTFVSAAASVSAAGLYNYVDPVSGEPVSDGFARDPDLETDDNPNGIVDLATREPAPGESATRSVLRKRRVQKTNPMLDAPAELGCAVAGGLNLMALIDAASRAARRRRY